MSCANTIWVLRAGALLNAPKAYLNYGHAGDVIVIPMSIINKLHHFDGIKHVMAENISDYVSKVLPREDVMGKGFLQENGTFLRVVDIKSDIDSRLRSLHNISEDDLQIFQLCYELMQQNPNSDVTLVSQNPTLLLQSVNLNIHCAAIADQIFPTPKNRYKGVRELFIPDKDFIAFLKEGKLYVDGLYGLHENEYLILKSDLGSGSTIARYYHGNLEKMHYQIYKNFEPKNVEQKFMSEALYAPPSLAPLIIGEGVAGTGKTYTTVAAAMNQLDCGSLFEHSYRKIIISTPAISDANENLGFLPGDIVGKLRPYFGGIIDNIIDFIISKNKKRGDSFGDVNNYKTAQNELEEYLANGLIEIQPLGFLAGHTFKDSFVIVDEAQNIDPNIFLNVVTRIGDGSKLSILGDPYQVKAPKLSTRVNGIVYMMEIWKNSDLAFQITMDAEKSVRGALCQQALLMMNTLE